MFSHLNNAGWNENTDAAFKLCCLVLTGNGLVIIRFIFCQAMMILEAEFSLEETPSLFVEFLSRDVFSESIGLWIGNNNRS